MKYHIFEDIHFKHVMTLWKIKNLGTVEPQGMLPINCPIPSIQRCVVKISMGQHQYSNMSERVAMLRIGCCGFLSGMKL